MQKSLFVVALISCVLLVDRACYSHAFQENATTAVQAVQQEECQNDCQGADGQCDNGNEKTPVSLVNKGKGNAAPDHFEKTHQQAEMFRPLIEGKPAFLSTFRVRPDGNLLACISDASVNPYGPAASKGNGPRGYLHLYSPDFELLDQIALPFVATALDLDQDGYMYIAGRGEIGKLSPSGEVISSRDSPNMVGVEQDELRKQVAEELKKRFQSTAQVYEKQIESLQKRIDKITELDETERTESQQRRLERYQTQLDSYQEIVDQQKIKVTDEMIDQQLSMKSRVTAVAVADNDLFVATSARVGFGYEVYRMDLNLENSKQLLDGLSGCCGQMDIHARGDQLFVAQNTKFNVGIYDRDGESIADFGERLNQDNQGFGSCCNPMNVLCCENGDILTAESSIGKIKRFNSDGELIGYIGRARIGGGCKHVAIGFDQKLDRYYVQYEDKHQICVLKPNAEVGDRTHPKVAALTEKLVGRRWKLANEQTSVDKANADASSASDEMREGIGLVIKQEESGEFTVADIIPKSPADELGRINKGDILLSVGPVSGKMQNTKGLSLADINSILQGNPGQTVRIKYRSTDSTKIRRSKLTQVTMKKTGGAWVVEAAEPDFGFSVEALTNMKYLEFHENGRFNAELETKSMGMGSAKRWLATKVADDALHIDLEGDDDMIMYRVKVKFTDADTAEIAVSYDGLGEEGKYRSYRGKDLPTAPADREKQSANETGLSDISN